MEAAALGRFGRLGIWTADHRRLVAALWGAVAVGLGALAPFAEDALSGAGWEVSGSESQDARRAIERAFPGRGAYALAVVVRAAEPGPALARVERVLGRDRAVSGVLQIAARGDTAIVLGLAGAPDAEMVRAAKRLAEPLAAAGGPGAEVRLTGPAGMWADFNEENKRAMLRSELLSWPLTLSFLVVAFGSLVAAGLPLLLTMVGLMAAAGLLFLAGHVTDVTIWAMNFAMMFAIALGIDYALFVVVRFRGALGRGLAPREAVGEAMETAGKAVFFSGLAVLSALLAVALVPSPAFRTVPIGMGLAVAFVLAASLTLLPAVLSKLGDRVNRLALPWSGATAGRNERFARWGARIWRRPVLYGAAAAAVLVALAAPVLDLRTGMPSIAVVPEEADSRRGYELVSEAFGPGFLAQLQVVVPGAPGAAVEALRADPGIAAVTPPETAGGSALVTAIPRADPAGRELGDTIDRVRRALPAGALVGGGAAENHDVEQALLGRIPAVYGAVLAIGFLLLLALLRAPAIASAAVALNVLATGAALGVGKLIFQDGHLAGLLRFEPQGFVNAWAPVFFFALIFALAMDYTVFLLATVKEHFERTGDAREATLAGLADSGRVINAAGGVMVIVFLTFALSGPIPPKEMGVVLAVAVLLDTMLVRLLLLPVALRALGARAWWIPPWLDRLLPKVRLSHGDVPEAPPVRVVG